MAAIVVLKPELSQSGKGGKSWGAMDMRRALKERLANYKIPQELKVIPDELPRNAMGKGMHYLYFMGPSEGMLTDTLTIISLYDQSTRKISSSCILATKPTEQ